jgi:murein DD-endopeptidase MepM/ murein hydrolase activator NlpD
VLQNYLTIMLVPNKSGRILRFELSAVLLKVIVAGLAGLLCVAIGVSFDYMIIKEKSRSHKAIESSLMMQQIAVQQIGNSLTGKQAKLNELENFDRKLRLISGLQESSTRIRYISASGQPAKTEYHPDISENHIQARIRKLDLDTKLREISFFQLRAYLQEQKDKLARTPSIAPTSGHISSRFGMRKDPFTGRDRFHAGVDFSAREFTPVYSPADGVVDNTWFDRDLGMFLVIDHGYNVVTRYGHLSKYEVQAGRAVKRGDLIARVGNTGRSTAAHLHYEILINDQYVDPEKFIFWD